MAVKPSAQDAQRDEQTIATGSDGSTDPVVQAELQTLESLLQQPLPANSPSEDPECQRLVELIGQIGKPVDGESPVRPADDMRERLGQYQLLEKLGEGGMGAVYKALHGKLQKLVALKVLPDGRLKNEQAVARFEREMRAVGRLNHPNIVAAHDAGEIDGHHYLVMELVDGCDLSALVRRCGPLPVAEACEVIRQAALGLEHAWSFGMVHRDIKPGNLMLTRDGQVKVLDMGLALLDEMRGGSGAVVELTTSGQMMGTLDYMAPEQGMDSHQVDIRADVYSLGATLFKLISGQPPFFGPKYDSPLSKMMALATEPPRVLSDVREDVPAELSALVARMLSKQADERPATPQEVVELLAPFAAGARLDEVARLATEAGERSGDDPSADTFAPLRSSFSPTDPAKLRPVTLVESQRVGASAVAGGSVGPQASRGGGRFGSGHRVALAAGFAGLVALGVILLSLRTPHGEVVVELGEDIPAEMAQDIKIEVAGNGQVKVADARAGWSIDVVEGKYQAQLAGGDDRFELDQQQVTVTRNRKTLLRVTLKATGDAGAGAAPEKLAGQMPKPINPDALSALKTVNDQSAKDFLAWATAPKRENTYQFGESLDLAPVRSVVDFDVAQRLATVDWTPGQSDPWLRGLAPFPTGSSAMQFQIWPKSWLERSNKSRRGIISPRGSAVAFTGDNYDLHLTTIDLDTGRVLGMGKRDSLSQRAWWSNDETRLLLGRDPYDSTLDLLTCHGRLLHRLRFPSDVLHFAWMPGDREILVVFENEYGLYAPDGQELLRKPVGRPINQYPLLHVSPDGEHFLISYQLEPKIAFVIHTESGRVVGELPSYGNYEWMRDNERILANDGNGAAIYTKTGRKLGDVKLESHRALDPGGTMAVWFDGTIRHLSDGSELARFPRRLGSYDQVFWDEPDKIRIVDSRRGNLMEEYTAQGKLLRSSHRPAPTATFAASWHRERAEFYAFPAGKYMPGLDRAFVWSPDGEKRGITLPKIGGIVLGGGSYNPVDSRVALGTENRQVTIADLASGETQSVNIGAWALNCSWSPNGNMLAVRSDNFVAIYHGDQKIRHFATTNIVNYTPASIQWNAASTHLAIWDIDNKVNIWDVRREDAEQRTIDTWLLSGIVGASRTAPSWNPDGSVLAVFSSDALQLVPADGGEIRSIPWPSEKAGPLWWTPDGNAVLVRGTIYDLDGNELRTLEPQVPAANALWRNGGDALVAWDGREVYIWDDLNQPATTIRLPWWADVAQFYAPWTSVAARGLNHRPLDPSGRYLAVVAQRELSASSDTGMAGEVAVIDLDEKRLLWTGLAFDDGTQIRVGPGGEYLSGPEQPDDYLVYLVHYGADRHQLALTQRQFAARIGLDPARRFLQRVLDYGGALQVVGESGWLREAQVPDATALPDPAEVVGVHLAGFPDVNNTVIEELGLLPNLETLHLSRTSITGLGLAPLKQCPKLRVVHLGQLKVGSGVALHLPPSVEELDLSGTDVNGLTLTDLEKFPKLARLYLADMEQLAPEAIETFQQKRPDCKVVLDSRP